MPEPAKGVRVDAVAPGSPASRAGLATGDRILSVSGRPVADLLDLHFLTSRSRYRIRWAGPSGEEREAVFRPAGSPLGVFPEPIRVRRCRNRCVFCFVRQLPRGLRNSLYVKDEDVRLSFLDGQYVTLTDVTEDEIQRIVRYRLSPLYVSIHATDPEVRALLLGNPRAADVMGVLRRLAAAGITLHGQIVVCPGINDGPVLERSLRTLATLRPGLATVAVVPVGLTAHRDGLPPLRPVGRDEARETLAALARLRRDIGDTGPEPFAVAADEYYLLAGMRVPGRKAYGSFPQIGNGVGLLRRFLDGARALFRRDAWPPARGAGGAVVSGLSPRAVVRDFLEAFSRRSGTRFLHLPVANRLFGPSVTVTGLLAGQDVLEALRTRRVRRVYLPSVCLRDGGDLFLDGLSPDDLSREAGADLVVFTPTPRGFREAVYKHAIPDYN